MALHAPVHIDKLRTKLDGLSTNSSDEQVKVEDVVAKNYKAYQRVMEFDPELPLHRAKHVAFLKKGLHGLSHSYECLDASRPWLVYWIVHALDLLGEPMSKDSKLEIVEFLSKCQSESGGFAGGPGQMPHLAPTYAAVCALCILGIEEAYSIIDRAKLQDFLMSCRTPEGAFRMHADGEVDIRGAYCACVAAHLTNIDAAVLFDGTAEWIASCQTYEGGFSGEPGVEAHGGYSFCGFAALLLLDDFSHIDIQRLLKWAVSRQMRLEGGFQGRTNKLVDGCYSFWQGGIFPLLHQVLKSKDDKALSTDKWLFDQVALQDYILINCQLPSGGLIDKPGKPRDFYHTCYCLSGLSIAQHFYGDAESNVCPVGGKENLLNPVHTVYNIGVDKALKALSHFRCLPIP